MYQFVWKSKFLSLSLHFDSKSLYKHNLNFTKILLYQYTNTIENYAKTLYNLWLQLWIQIQRICMSFSKFPKNLYLQSKLCIFNENCNFLPQFHFLSSKLTISFVLMAFLTPHYLRFDFLMISSWFLYDFLMISSWSPHDFLMISSWFPHDFFMVSSFSRIILMILDETNGTADSFVFLLTFHWFFTMSRGSSSFTYVSKVL